MLLVIRDRIKSKRSVGDCSACRFWAQRLMRTFSRIALIFPFLSAHAWTGSLPLPEGTLQKRLSLTMPVVCVLHAGQSDSWQHTAWRRGI